MPSSPDSEFSFEISLSVLNHLGRNLYRNFNTVLGEAISNSWDADARNVWIDIDRGNSCFSIKDDGIGMSADDFQSKFLKIGYSKRSKGRTKTTRKRPFIGAKGIGKLALLSCADRISVFSKKRGRSYIGGTIDNSGLDKAIKDDLTPDQYPLEAPDLTLIEGLSESHAKGTIIVFEGTKQQIRNSVAHIKKMLALYFRFSLLDKEFAIHVNGDEVTIDDLRDLSDSTEFAWIINKHKDEYVSSMKELKNRKTSLTTTLSVQGFIASVEKPRHLKITGTDERATIDLFVNGRLREKNILRRIPTQRVVESYLYGQVHFDEMDAEGVDPFTSSREGIVEGDEKFESLLEYMSKEALPKVFDDWDRLRLQRGSEGDEENKRKSKKQRKARDLYALSREEYSPGADSPNKDQVDEWLDDLRDDAEFNISSYVDCFLSENLARKYIIEKNVKLKPKIQQIAAKWRQVEQDKKGKANLSIDLRKVDTDIDYLGMDDLAFSIEGKSATDKVQSLWRDAKDYAPMRNVVGHTGLLTENAKERLRLTYENIKARVKALVANT